MDLKIGEKIPTPVLFPDLNLPLETIDEISEFSDSNMDSPSRVSDSDNENEKFSFDLQDFVKGIKQKDLIPLDLPDIWEQEMIGANKCKRKCTIQAIRSMKKRYLGFYSNKLSVGWYDGFMGTVICKDCKAVLDCYPCIEKRIYWVPKKHCYYCRKIEVRPTKDDYDCIEKMHRCTSKRNLHIFDVTFKDD